MADTPKPLPREVEDALLEEACRQWYAFIQEDTERSDGAGFAYFCRTLSEQLLQDKDFMEGFQPEEAAFVDGFPKQRFSSSPSISAISAAAEQARARANQEPNQGGYNAAWLHGYAQALTDVAEQQQFPSVSIDGAPSHPNDGSRKSVRFIDSEYRQLFTVPDGANIILSELDGTHSILPCQYIDDTHALIYGVTFHIHQFALVQEQRGAVYLPEHPGAADICDTYEVYQLKDVDKTAYGFCSYEAAKDKLHPSHYVKVYAGNLAPGVTLDDIYAKHNQDLRPRRTEMRSMSVSDVVVLNRGGTRKAYYVNNIGFCEAERFLKPPARDKKRAGQER